MTAIRSLVFLLGGVLVTSVFGILVPAGRLFGFRKKLYLGGSISQGCDNGTAGPEHINHHNLCPRQSKWVKPGGC